MKKNTIQLCIATRSAYKVKEITSLMPTDGLGITILGLKELGIEAQPEESGKSFFENALLKARFYANKIKGCNYSKTSDSAPLVLAEDSGLCVDALGGRPGIYSARYAMDALEKIPREQGPTHFQCRKLLEEMKEHSMRSARFICCAVLYKDEENFTVQQSSWEGEIIDGDPRGDKGFGYDPIFYLRSHNCTSAELSPEQKNLYSHRGKAIRILYKLIKFGIMFS